MPSIGIGYSLKTTKRLFQKPKILENIKRRRGKKNEL